MKTRHVLVIGSALAALAGCTSATTQSAAPASAPVSGPVSGPVSAAPQPSESIDAGTLEATSAYLTALRELDQKLVGSTRTALDNGMETCVDIEERRTEAVQEKNIATRFVVDAAQAKKILALTKANLCLQ